MRLILLVRRLQGSQVAILRRFDEVRALTAAVSSFRGEFQDLDQRLDRASESFARMEQGLSEGFSKLEPPEISAEKVEVFDEGVARLEAVAQHLGELGAEAANDPRGEELEATLAFLQELGTSLEAIAGRLSAAEPPVPPVPPAAESPAEREPTPVEPADEGELVRLREALRAAELTRHELESKHAQQLTEVADHGRAAARRLEDDLKKKKRGLAELTQQNIALQNEVARLREELAAASRSPERLTPALPAETGSRPSLMQMFQPGEEAQAYRKEREGLADEAEAPVDVAPGTEPQGEELEGEPTPSQGRKRRKG
jgi:DNA repair exonuclease SbcCD ATPase subunit